MGDRQIQPVLPLVRSGVQCQRDFHPSHHSGMGWDYAAVHQQGGKKKGDQSKYCGKGKCHPV